MLGTHASKLERWLGVDEVERLSRSCKDWYGPPIAVEGVPGSVWIGPGGDFRGRIETGVEATAKQTFRDLFRRLKRTARYAGKMDSLSVGFASLSDLISEATAGKRRQFLVGKGGFTGVISATTSIWGGAGTPTAGANASNAPGGDAPTSATTGAIPFTNPTGGDTQHITKVDMMATVGATLLVYDRLFQVNKTMNSTTAEAVTGTQSRYASTTATADDYAGGNFMFVEVGGTALAATAHNWTVCQYTNQAGTTAQSAPSMAGNASAIVRRLDHPLGQWFMPLASGDTGVRYLTQMQCDAAVATGVINFVIGHPLIFVPCPIANLMTTVDGVNTSFSLVRVMDNAAIAMLDVIKSATTSTNFAGMIETVAG